MFNGISLMNYLMTATIALAATAAVTVGLAWLFARLYGRPKRRLPKKTPADYGLSFTPISFNSGGALVNGWFIPANGSLAPGPAIILAHGWSNNATQLLPIAEQLHQAGFGVLLYDARGHGASGNVGPIVTVRTFAEDMIAAVDYLAGRPDVDATRLGVVAHSMGGAGAILAASIEPGIRALVSSSAFADPLTLTRRMMRALHLPRGPFLWLVCFFLERWLGTSMQESAPQNRIGLIAAPVLLIHGDADRFIPPTNLDTLYAQAHPERTQRWLVPGRHHVDVLRHPEYASRITRFLTEHLAVDEAQDPTNGEEGLGRHTYSPDKLSEWCRVASSN